MRAPATFHLADGKDAPETLWPHCLSGLEASAYLFRPLQAHGPLERHQFQTLLGLYPITFVGGQDLLAHQPSAAAYSLSFLGSFKGEVANLGAAAGVSTSIAMQPKAPLLICPGPGQRAD